MRGRENWKIVFIRSLLTFTIYSCLILLSPSPRILLLDVGGRREIRTIIITSIPSSFCYHHERKEEGRKSGGGAKEKFSPQSNRGKSHSLHNNKLASYRDTY
jgi:hypothetical protein